jgi:cyclopropane fatty-acyl-phospholipid synthase-like methyltransferase
MNHFDQMYLATPPWDSGITPPELYEFLEQHPPGRAIDLGCGTGTNVITLAQHGWDATGVDFSQLAIQKAQNKAKTANVHVTFKTQDVTKLNGITGPFNLALDMGCFHNLHEKQQDYLDQLDEILAPGGYWLLYVHLRPAHDTTSTHGLLPSELLDAQSQFDLVYRKDSYDKGGWDSAWILLQKKTAR